MTHSGGKPHTNIGDRGQRFEVSYWDSVEQKHKVFGWSETEPGAERLCESIRLHPSMKAPLILDRES